jgi:hypothetical protein
MRNARKATKALLLETFGVYDYIEATAPYPFKYDWKHIALGKRRLGNRCVFRNALVDDPHVTGALVLEHFSYVRFAGSDKVWRFQNPLDMREAILDFDLDQDSLEPGEFTLEPVRKHSSNEYQAARRKAIKEGTRTVRSRGRNTNMARGIVLHYRPY